MRSVVEVYSVVESEYVGSSALVNYSYHVLSYRLAHVEHMQFLDALWSVWQITRL